MHILRTIKEAGGCGVLVLESGRQATYAPGLRLPIVISPHWSKESAQQKDAGLYTSSWPLYVQSELLESCIAAMSYSSSLFAPPLLAGAVLEALKYLI